LREQTRYLAPRQLLHARHLAFRHPRSRVWREFDAPLPEDFRVALDCLRRKP
jgi:23S rRNA pseudouridine1911/1915/1917 synthase